MTVDHHHEPDSTRAEAAALAGKPGAVAMAFDLSGRFTIPPASLPMTPVEVTARTLVELVVAGDHTGLVAAWRALGRRGRGDARVRLLNRPDRVLDVVFLDLTATDGVVVGVIWSDDGESIDLEDVRARSRFGVIYETGDADVLGVDAGYIRMTGYTFEDVIGKPALDAVHPDDQTLAIDAWMDMVQTGRSRPRRWRTRCSDDTYLWVEVVIARQLDTNLPGQVVVEVTDISDEVAARERLEAQELLLNRMAQVVPVGLFQVDAGEHVVYANDRLAHMLGTDRGDLLEARLSTVLDEDRQLVLDGIRRVLAHGTDEDVEGEVHPPEGGEPRRCVFAVRPLPDPSGSAGAIVCVSDITETARQLVTLERDLIHRSFHDALTGLPNRTLLINGMDEAIADSREEGRSVAVLLIDVDGFKAFNDSLGHGVGDELLRALSDRIRAVVRPTDLVARIGGDELAVLMDDFIDPDHPRRTAEQVVAACAQPFEVDGHLMQTSVSIGIASTATATGSADLLRDADLAMYRAKAAGRGRYEIFEPEMHAAAIARVELEASLREGIAAGQLILLYQPIHDLVSGTVSSAEALVRWRHPLHGMVSPADFIPLAEETGLIVPLGRFVLEEACAEAARWVERFGAAAPRVSVNLSARQMASPTVLDDVLGALSRSGLDPARLQLEITESVLMEHHESSATVLSTLRSMGVTIAIDDFGTGYSSLAYLERLPVDIIKIDKAFVDRIDDGGRHAKLIKGILSLTHDLGLTAVAEGIETVNQLDALEALSCPSGQGYLFSRPIDADSLRTYVHERTTSRSHDPLGLRSVV